MRTGVSYTQWEAWLALYHGNCCSSRKRPRAPNAGQNTCRRKRHAPRKTCIWHNSKQSSDYPGCTFTSPDNLAKHILSSAILDLLVKEQVLAYAEELGRERDVAEGFIHEMAQKVAGDRNLDLEGMQRAVETPSTFTKRDRRGTNGNKLRRHRRCSTLEGAIVGGRRQIRFGSRVATQGVRGLAPKMKENATNAMSLE